MRPRPLLLLFTSFALALMAAGEVDAEREPKWNYATGGSVHTNAIATERPRE